MNEVKFIGFNIIKSLENIINEEGLSGDEKIILVTISFYHTSKIDNNPAMSLSNEDIAKITNRNKCTGAKIAHKLIDKGYIDVIRQGQGKPNIYIFKGWRKWQ